LHYDFTVTLAILHIIQRAVTIAFLIIN